MNSKRAWPVLILLASFASESVPNAASAEGTSQSQGSAPVSHPNLFLNREEIRAIQDKIGKYPWAAALGDRLRKQADDTRDGGHQFDWFYDKGGLTWSVGRRLKDVALVYALDGQPRCADKVREVLLQYERRFEGKPVTLDAFTDAMGGISLCWAYDLTYDRFSPGERVAVEQFFLRWADTAMKGLEQYWKARSSSPEKWRAVNNISFWGRAFCGVVGYTVGNRELIAFAVESPGGLKWAIENCIHDHALWHEANGYEMVYVSSAMAALAEAALHYDGADLYHWKAPNGNWMKDYYDTCLALSFPGELRVATFGDYSTNSPLVSASEACTGHQVGDYFLINDRDGRDWNKYDLAYRRFGDPAYAWVLAQNPKRDEWDHALWGLLALTHGGPLPESPRPPAAKSAVFPESGVAMLRAEESADYWTSKSPAALVRFGPAVSHGHYDQFHITLHGKGRLLEPDWFIQWDYMDRKGRNPTPWSRHSLAHNTMLVDKGCMPILRESLSVMEQDLGDTAKVLRIGGEVYPGVVQSRTLALTRQYLLDIFQAQGSQEHTYDWVLHGLGELTFPELVFAPYDLGADLGFNVIDRNAPDTAENRWIRRGMQSLAAQAWRAAWTQEDGVGVQVTMLGEPATAVFRGDGPYYVSAGGLEDRIPDGRTRAVPLVVARRKGPSALFVVLHEPFDREAPAQIAVRQIASTPDALMVEITMPACRDYFIYARVPDKPVAVTAEIGTFRLAGGCGYLRIAPQGVTAQGGFESVEVRPDAVPAGAALRLNGLLVPWTARPGRFVRAGGAARP